MQSGVIVHGMNLLVILACQTGPESWNTLADCEALSGANQDECFRQVGVETAKTDKDAGVAIIERISDPLIKDYGWHSLTRDVDPTSHKWCERIQNEKLADRCRVIVSRPHMHEHLVEDGRMPPQAKGHKGPPPKTP